MNNGYFGAAHPSLPADLRLPIDTRGGKRKTQSFVLFTRLCKLEPRCRVYLSGPSLTPPTDDRFVAAFPTVRQCEDFIRTAYHQCKTVEEILHGQY